jgi:methanogenic corrinoid protein MtbC1
MKKTEPRHPIGVVSKRTGLRPDLIRVWEARYGAVEPARTESKHRLYSDADIERLVRLRELVQAGQRIGRVATLSEDELDELLRDHRSHSRGGRLEEDWTATLEAHSRHSAARAVFPLEDALDAVAALDRTGLQATLEEASVRLSRVQLLDRFLVPLMHAVGDLCAVGKLRTVHEHSASTVVRSFVEQLEPAFAPAATAPHLIVSTAAWQHHELGALLVAATARSEGWRVTYLGPNLPAEEVAAAAWSTDARAVALSLTYPDGDDRVASQLHTVGRLLPEGVTLIVGGRAAGRHESVLREIGAIRLDSLADLREYLQQMRGQRP